jgi:hypothetical protein
LDGESLEFTFWIFGELLSAKVLWVVLELPLLGDLGGRPSELILFHYTLPTV